MSCAVCERHRTKDGLPGGAIFADALLFIAHFPLLANESSHYGHVILEMQRHVTKPSELTDEEAQSVGLWTKIISSALETKLGAEHVYIVRIGDKTPHLHFHFVPRYPGTPQEVWGPQLWLWNGGRKATASDMIEVTELLKSSISF